MYPSDPENIRKKETELTHKVYLKMLEYTSMQQIKDHEFINSLPIPENCKMQIKKVVDAHAWAKREHFALFEKSETLSLKLNAQLGREVEKLREELSRLKR